MKSVFAYILLFLSLSAVSHAQEAKEQPSLDELRQQVQALEQRAAVLEEENEGLKRMLRAREDGEVYIVVDTENNRLSLRRGERVLRNAVCSSGSRELVEDEYGRTWYFETPNGAFRVLAKERNPVWIRPDWSYVEENMPVPALNDPDRIVRDVLGKYALVLGNGYKIHGTTFKDLLGTHFTHGCISMGDADLEAAYKASKVGTRVYLY